MIHKKTKGEKYYKKAKKPSVSSFDSAESCSDDESNAESNTNDNYSAATDLLKAIKESTDQNYILSRLPKKTKEWVKQQEKLEHNKRVKQRALNKLSSEEKEILGIRDN